MWPVSLPVSVTQSSRKLRQPQLYYINEGQQEVPQKCSVSRAHTYFDLIRENKKCCNYTQSFIPSNIVSLPPYPSLILRCLKGTNKTQTTSSKIRIFGHVHKYNRRIFPLHKEFIWSHAQKCTVQFVAAVAANQNLIFKLPLFRTRILGLSRINYASHSTYLNII